jgi:hypothetical protein
VAAAAGAAAEVPALTYIAAGLLAALAWIVCLGLAYGYRSTFGWFLERLAELLPAKHWYFPVNLRGAVRGVNHDFLQVLTNAANKSEHAMGYLFHGAAVLQEWATREMLHLAAETLSGLEWLAHVHVPKWAKLAALAAFPPALIARLVAHEVAKELPGLIRVTRTTIENPTKVITLKYAIPYLGQWRWLHDHWHSLQEAISRTAALAPSVTFPHVTIFPRIRILERDGAYVHKRLKRIEALLGVTAFAGMMAASLGLPNWRCLTRGNVGRTARALCGIPTHVLNDLLGLLVDFLVITDICQVITLLSEAFAVVEGPLADFAGAAGGALCHGDFEAAPAVHAPAPTPPPLQQRPAILAV